MKRSTLAVVGLCAVMFSPVAMTRTAHAQTVDCTGVAAWNGNSVSYAVGALVTYQGSEYKCLQAHTSNPTWDPVDAASLWSKVGTCSTSTTGGTCSSVPAAPGGLAASGTTSTGTNLSWTAVTPPSNCSISSYTIYRGGTSIGTATGTTFAVSGLTAGTTYTFTVAATDAAGTGAQSSSISVTTSSASCTTKPNAPAGLAASNTSSSGTTLTWSAVSAPANCSISGYTVYKGGTSIGTTTSTSFNVTGLSASTTYSFTVAASDAAGTGAQSSSISVTTSGSGTGCWAAWNSTTAYNGGAQVSYANVNYTAAFWTQGDEPDTHNGPSGSGQPWISNGPCGGASCTTVPSAPSGLAASGTTQTSTNLTWNAVSAPANCSISGYTVYRNGTSIGTTTSTSFSATGLTAGTTYTFTVAATDAAGTGAQSSSISVTTSANTCTTKPSAPSGLAASGTTSSSTTLSWGAVTAPSGCTITGYTVYQGAAAIATVSSGTSYTVTGLAASTTYTFTVAANDGAGTGAQSSSVSVTTQANTGAKGKVIGYWETWASLPLLTAATNYDVIEVAFAMSSGTDGATQTWPATTESSAQIASDIATLHSQGKKVLISVGGANTYTLKLQNTTDQNNFVSSVESIVDTWHLDGVDLDIENNNLALNPGDTDINNPTTPSTVYMIAALNALKSHYGSSFMITMAPQVADINAAGHALGNDGAGLYWGSFIPLINKTRGILTYVMTQEYNASDMYAKDGTTIYKQGNPDFDVAMTDLLLSGYNIYGTGQAFAPLNQNQIVIGTPAVTAAAGSGYNTPAQVDQAIKYIKFGTSFGGTYHLTTTYPNFGGVMTWDCNYDYNAGDPMSSAVAGDVHL